MCLQASLKNLSASMTIIHGRTKELLIIQYTRMSHAMWPPDNWSMSESEGIYLILARKLLFFEGKELTDIKSSGITGSNFAILFSFFDFLMERIDKFLFLLLKSFIDDWVINKMMRNKFLPEGMDFRFHLESKFIKTSYQNSKSFSYDYKLRELTKLSVFRLKFKN